MTGISYLSICFFLVQVHLHASGNEGYCSAKSESCMEPGIGYHATKWDGDEKTKDDGIVDSSDNLFSNVIPRAYQEWTPCSTNAEDSCKTCFDDQIESDLKTWSKKGINQDLIHAAKLKGVHYQVIGKKLYREKNCLFPGRCEGVEHFILQIVQDLPDLELVINIRDWAQVPCRSRSDDCIGTGVNHGDISPVFSFSKDSKWYCDILYPAWSFWSGGPAIDKYPRGIGNWNRTRNLIQKNSLTWEKKEIVAFFRGSRTSPERDPIVLFSRNHPNLLDAKYTKNQAWRSLADTLGHEPAPTVTFEDQCRYKYLLNVRGVAASFRFKHLFLCKSLVLNVDSDWIEFFYPPLKPWVHYIPIQEDFKDFYQVITFIQNNDEYARKVAENGFDLIWNHLTIESITCYWKNLLSKYSKLLTYKPKLDPSLIQIS